MDYRGFQTDEILRRNKRVAAVHEAGHAFVGQALSLRIVSAQLKPNPGGGLAAKHWVGSTRWQDCSQDASDELPASAARLGAMRLRLYSLAGSVAEEVFGPRCRRGRARSGYTRYCGLAAVGWGIAFGDRPEAFTRRPRIGVYPRGRSALAPPGGRARYCYQNRGQAGGGRVSRSVCPGRASESYRDLLRRVP